MAQYPLLLLSQIIGKTSATVETSNLLHQRLWGKMHVYNDGRLCVAFTPSTRRLTATSPRGRIDSAASFAPNGVKIVGYNFRRVSSFTGNPQDIAVRVCEVTLLVLFRPPRLAYTKSSRIKQNIALTQPHWKIRASDHSSLRRRRIQEARER